MSRPTPTSSGDPGLDRLKTVLGSWRNSLLDMGGRNRLLNFRHTRSSTLELLSPGASAVLAGLTKGWDFAPVDEEAAAEGAAAGVPVDAVHGLVTQKATQRSLDAALHQLRSKSQQMFNDYGLWVLWLGVGILDWCEDGANEISSAPLLLVPVELRRDGRGRVQLWLGEDQDRIHNPALAVRLERIGIDWSPVTAAEPGDPAAVIAAARRIAAEREGWQVEERLVIGLFASYKEAMYQDLQQNEERILAHPLVRSVALGPDSGVAPELIDFTPADLDRIDELQLPERTPLVLDADASQRQCIAAALEGRSFVMSGPPGTGKSQTITNMIAALIHAGRSVLFVSEKAAALDVVRNRLRGVGLGDFVLSLHSGDTSRKAVAVELARVLTTEARVTGAAEYELDRARQLREELSAYAAAMNQTRGPLQRSLHDVLGRLVLLEQAGTPQVPMNPGNVGSVRALEAGALQAMLAAAEAIGRAWRPVAEGESFAWRGLTGTAALAAAEEAADALTGLGSASAGRPFATTIPEPKTSDALHQLVGEVRAGLPNRASGSGVALPAECSGVLAKLAELLGMPEPATPRAAFALLDLADLASAAHRPLREWFDAETRRQAHQAEQALDAAIIAATHARSVAAEVFGEQVLTATELPELVRRFAEEHRGLMGRFSAQYKTDRAAVSGLVRDGVTARTGIGRLSQALAWHSAAAEVERLARLHGALLGRYTPRVPGEQPTLREALATAVRIAELAAGAVHRDRLVAVLADGTQSSELVRFAARAARETLTDWCDATQTRLTRWSEAFAALRGLFDSSRQIELSLQLSSSLDQARMVVDALLADRDGPDEWRAHQDGLAVLARHGAADLVARTAERGGLPQQLSNVVEQAVLKVWADDVLSTDPRLRATRSADLDARVEDFRDADRRLVVAAAGAVIEACNSRRPRQLASGAAAVITRQAGLKARHMPVRDLLGRARHVVSPVKPCFMMSPLTVSQFLPPDYHFDVVIFDEASQVRPGDAINCIYRGDSLVVAGDAKQLPPTSFFDSSVEDESDEYDADVPDSFESLLDACKAGAMRELPLRWHYRSRHEDLITFSNRSFYQNSMVTFPGAVEAGNDVGVELFDAQGHYDRGGRRDNRAEAEFVARRVIHHFDTRPGRTLGVVALSQAQATAIDEAVQQARLQRPDLNGHFTEDRLDGFFVKNLESVQGDERDVMIMSIGYGPDEYDKLTTNFGPINKDGGWRRLNVAVTRARYRMEVVASFRSSRLPDSQNESVQHLKRYLDYAEHGPAVLARDLVQEQAEPDSPFEESVLQVLRGWGYQVQPQVGVAGYRIDLGVRRPDAPGAYALGIECDGAMYHSSRVARDRDRLREEVLAGLGWRLHRIWGTDWYRGRAAAESRLREAVEQAVVLASLNAPVRGDHSTSGVTATGAQPSGEHRTEGAHPDGQRLDHVPPQPPAPVEHERVPVAAPDREWSAPYEIYQVSAASSYDLHTPEARPAIERVLLAIIEQEGPIHEEILVQRVREAWGVGRAGSRIRDNIRVVRDRLVRSGRATLDGDFVDLVRDGDPAARHPGRHAARKLVHVAPRERWRALVELANECPGMSQDELVRQACEFFGWQRVTKETRTSLEADIADLRSQGVFEVSSGHIATTGHGGVISSPGSE
ncbi:DUF3320 domain-containing protein [Kitasatospora aureofaciens]|uniref:DUF3320 domain-containing protein n=1 Tax=Kitasatospora aureofaciens TaxID=1894 RepID=UPI0033A811F8